MSKTTKFSLEEENIVYLLGKPPKVTKVISYQLDIKLEDEERDLVLKKSKIGKLRVLMKYPKKYGRLENSSTLLRYSNAVYNQNTIDRWTKKGDLEIAKNYRDITLNSIAAKINNSLLRNRIEPKIEKLLWKNQNGFRRNRFTTSQILTIRRILEVVCAKISRRHYYLQTSPRHLNPYTEGRASKYFWHTFSSKKSSQP